MKALRRLYFIVYNIVHKVFGLLELLLFLRLILKFLNASSKALIVNFIYRFSDVLVSPFEFIFPDIYWRQAYPIESATVSAIIGYWIAFAILFQLLRALLKE